MILPENVPGILNDGPILWIFSFKFVSFLKNLLSSAVMRLYLHGFAAFTKS